uniref:Uncharacterized protein n=1 Tax=Denticeps clupeoides TaxID=299321 RepID=A0AAY4E1L8_9TELE
VVESPGPVDGDVRLLLVQFHGTGCAAGGELTEFEQAVEHGTVFSHVNSWRTRCPPAAILTAGAPTSLHLLAVLGHVVRADGAEELDVVVAVVLGHLLGVGLQIVGHADSVGFHGMSLAIIVVTHVTWGENERVTLTHTHTHYRGDIYMDPP